MDVLLREAPSITLSDNTLSVFAVPYWDGSADTEHLAPEYKRWERFAPGCFDRWLKSGNEILAYYSHDKRQIIGRSPETMKVWADAKGVHGEISLTDTSYEKDLRELVRSKKVKGASFGYISTRHKDTQEGPKPIRTIQEAILTEISPVGRPAFKATTVALREARPDYDRFLDELYREEYEKRIAQLDTMTPSGC